MSVIFEQSYSYIEYHGTECWIWNWTQIMTLVQVCWTEIITIALYTVLDVTSVLLWHLKVGGQKVLLPLHSKPSMEVNETVCKVCSFKMCDLLSVMSLFLKIWSENTNTVRCLESDSSGDHFIAKVWVEIWDHS